MLTAVANHHQRLHRVFDAGGNEAEKRVFVDNLLTHAVLCVGDSRLRIVLEEKASSECGDGFVDYTLHIGPGVKYVLDFSCLEAKGKEGIESAIGQAVIEARALLQVTL